MIILILVLLGLCAGSFINALVWRVHEQEKASNKNKRPDLSIIKGRSMCPSCHHELATGDLLPILSWAVLRGRCRYCQAKISWQYPFVELVTTALFLVSYSYWPYNFSNGGLAAFGLWLSCLVILIALFVYDLRWMILPNRLVYPLLGLALGFSLALGVINGEIISVVWALAGGLLFSGFFWCLFQLSKGKWIGGGDVKIALALGVIAGGILESILVLFLASLVGTIVSLPLLLRHRTMKHKVPFGPFLITATVIVFFFGAGMIAWYRGLLAV